jgi:TM2 domain-containing membrane protein YozV
MENPIDDPREPLTDAETPASATETTASTYTPYTRPQPPPLPLPTPQPPPMYAPQAPQVKAPLLALFLSVFPGLGQLYNEQPAKAVTFFFFVVGSIYGTAMISPFPFAFLIPFAWFYNLIDAWTSANDINRREGLGMRPRKDKGTESPLWGGTLLALGLLLLINNLGWLDLARLSRYWPLIMVVVGGVFLARALKAREASSTSPRDPF